MPKDNNAISLRITRRELATILAALRFHQDENLQGGRGIPDQFIKEIATDGGQFKPLSFQEVGELCERLDAEREEVEGRREEAERNVQHNTVARARDYFCAFYSRDVLDGLYRFS